MTCPHGQNESWRDPADHDARGGATGREEAQVAVGIVDNATEGGKDAVLALQPQAAVIIDHSPAEIIRQLRPASKDFLSVFPPPSGWQESHLIAWLRHCKLYVAPLALS